MHNLRQILANVHGNSIMGIDTEIDCTLRKTMNGRGTPPNPHYGRVRKRHVGAQVMVFQNKNVNGYENMVERRLITEGKNPSRFQLQPRTWGERIPNLPIVQHITKNSVNPQFYLEVIFLRPGESTYYLDGNPIAKDQIIGLTEPKLSENGQGGLDAEDRVIIRTYAVDSLTAIRIDKTAYQAPFFFA